MWLVASKKNSGLGIPKYMEASPENDRITQSTIATNPSVWLGIWMFNNIVLLLLNKAAFEKADFKYPFFLSFVHMLCNFIGAIMNLGCNNCVSSLVGKLNRQKLDKSGKRTIAAFSVIVVLNIGTGNVSLRYVTLNFNQIMRSAGPAVTMAMASAMGKSFSLKRKISIIPVVCGVAMACYGDMSYTTIGLFFTICLVFLTSLKVIAAGEMLTGALKLHPVELIWYMAPLAMIQFIIISFATGEISSMVSRWETELNPIVNPLPMFVVLLSGVLSYTLNIASFMANKLTSPLTLCVFQNVKQGLLIGLSTIIFRTEITVLNGSGIFVVLLGSAYYSYTITVETIQSASNKKRVTNKDKQSKLKVNAVEKNEEEGMPLVSNMELVLSNFESGQ